MLTSKQLDLQLKPMLEAHGLYSFGWFKMDDGCCAVLIGNHVKDQKHLMFDALKTSPEYKDGQADPMNRWTKRVVCAIADELDIEARFPFGETIWPFQMYAKQATGMKTSPLGILMHPEFGLWTAFRAVLIFNEPVSLEKPLTKHHPCDSCETKPCLTSCPVSAFSNKGLDVSACFAHLDSKNEPDCLNLGCRARAACPVGVPYSNEQIAFHMKAFRG